MGGYWILFGLVEDLSKSYHNFLFHVCVCLLSILVHTFVTLWDNLVALF